MGAELQLLKQLFHPQQYQNLGNFLRKNPDKKLRMGIYICSIHFVKNIFDKHKPLELYLQFGGF